ncbi:hypothetical protein quinque_002285 [Culex quinquefasciatus]|uniref:Uncharacterized protein n=1 Tax=Culex pipiens pipiens TaxID=38569 RepID=A0ABD1DCC3_CULPP
MAGASLFDTSQKSSPWIEVAIKCFRQVVLGDGRKAASKPPSTLARLRFRLPVCPCCICSSSYFDRPRTTASAADMSLIESGDNTSEATEVTALPHVHEKNTPTCVVGGGATAGPQCFQQAASFIKFPMQYSQFGPPSPAQIVNLMEQHDVTGKGSES